MADIALKSVRKEFGPATAVDGVGLDITSGEFLVILGPSGCGKSTLLRMIAGLEEITSGTVSIDGTVVNDLEPGARGCAMVFQNYALYPHMSVAANIGYGLKVAGVPKAERAAKVAEIARMLELDALLDRKPAQLSGGQRQRVAMGRAMIRAPKVFLFDEPLSNLDAKLRVQMRVEIKRLHRQLGTTSIFVTHDQLEAMTMADRLVVMNGGRIEQVGTPQEIFHRPASRFVAGFIGTPAMNMVEARIGADGGLEAIGRWRPCPGSAWDLAPGTPVTLGIRPSSLRPVAATTAAPDFTADLFEDVGTETYLHARGADIDLTLSLPPATPLPQGPFGVSFAAEDAHVFDAASGLRAARRPLSEPQDKESRAWTETSLSST